MTGLSLEEEARRQLQRITAPQIVSEQQVLSRACQRSAQLGDDPRAHVLIETRDGSITLACGDGALALTPCQRRCHFDLGQPARRDAIPAQRFPNLSAALLMHVALGERTGVEVDDQNLSFRRSMTACASDPPRLLIGRNVASDVRVGKVTAPVDANRTSSGGIDSSATRGRNSAIGSPRSVTMSVCPERTRRR